MRGGVAFALIGLAAAVAGLAAAHVVSPMSWWPSWLPAWTACAGAAGLLVAVLYARLVDPLLIGVFWRVFLALLPVMGLAGIVVAVLIFAVDFPDDLLRVLIAGTLLAAGWVATWLATEYQRARDRYQTRRDVLLALRAEIFAAFQTLDATDWAASAEVVQARIREGGDGPKAYHSFTGSESPPIVFDAVSASIPLLQAQELSPILRFYASLTDLATLAQDSQRAEFHALTWERRIAMHRQLTDTRIATLYWSLNAIYAINVGLGVPDPANVPRSGENDRITVDPTALSA